MEEAKTKTMTPKEEAEQIIDKYMPMMYCYLGSGMLTNSYDEGVAKSNAKSCAILHCQGIIDFMMLDDAKHEDCHWANSPEVVYWYEVKNEINKL
jgi:hypothetical protein